MFDLLIMKHATIPAQASKIFTTVSDNQTSISVPIVENSTQNPNQTRQIGILKLEGILPCKAGVPKVEVIFEVDSNNMVTASATETGTGKSVKIHCNAFELSQTTLNQYHQLVQNWIKERRKRWPTST